MVLSIVDKFDTNIAQKIQQLGVYNRFNRYDLVSLIQQISVDEDHYIIIDNLQYIHDEFLKYLLQALLHNTCYKLHLVVLTQYYSMEQMSAYKQYINVQISEKDLSLNKNDILEYSKLIGIEIDTTTLAELYQYSEGWIVVISLCLHSLKEKDSIAGFSDIRQLIYSTCWGNLPEKEQRFLLIFSIWQTIHEETLFQLLEKGDFQLAIEEVISLMVRVPLIKYNTHTNNWIAHNILFSYLKERYEILKIVEQRAILSVAGEVEKAQGNHRQAINFFYQARQYDALLSCENVNMLKKDIGGILFKEIANHVLEEASNTILKKHMLSSFRFCYILYAETDFVHFQKYLHKLQEL